VPADGKTTIAMTLDMKQAAAREMLGIAKGCAVSHLYFAGFRDDSEGDGVADLNEREAVRSAGCGPRHEQVGNARESHTLADGIERI